MTDFEIDPLDINLAKIQFKLINDGLEILPQIYESKDPTRFISTIVIEFVNQKIVLSVKNKNKSETYTRNVYSGTAEEIENFIKSKDFLFSCKSEILKINDLIKNK